MEYTLEWSCMIVPATLLVFAKNKTTRLGSAYTFHIQEAWSELPAEAMFGFGYLTFGEIRIHAVVSL